MIRLIGVGHDVVYSLFDGVANVLDGVANFPSASANRVLRLPSDFVPDAFIVQIRIVSEVAGSLATHLGYRPGTHFQSRD